MIYLRNRIIDVWKVASYRVREGAITRNPSLRLSAIFFTLHVYFFPPPVSFQPAARMLLFHEVNQSGVVFADEGLLVGAGDVVPGHTVAVEVVHDGEARLVVLALMDVGKE